MRGKRKGEVLILFILESWHSHWWFMARPRQWTSNVRSRRCVF